MFRQVRSGRGGVAPGAPGVPGKLWLRRDSRLTLFAPGAPSIIFADDQGCLAFCPELVGGWQTKPVIHMGEWREYRFLDV